MTGQDNAYAAPRTSGGFGGAGMGCGLVWLCHAVVFFVWSAVTFLNVNVSGLLSPALQAAFGVMSILAGGLAIAQVLYVVPIVLIAMWRGRYDVAKGATLGAALTVLLSGVFYGLVVAGIAVFCANLKLG